MKSPRQKASYNGEKVLRLFWQESEAESISGDLETLARELMEVRGPLRAHLWYWFQIFRSAAESVSVRLYWGAALLRSNLRITRRTVSRNKSYSFIVVFSLAVGLAVCVLILQWIQHERNYDMFHSDVDQIFRLTVRHESSPPDKGTYAVPGPASAFLQAEYPEVLDSTRFCPIDDILLGKGDKRFFARCAFVDSSFLNMFAFPLIRGEAGSVLSQPLSMVLTDGLARKFFGRDDPVGQALSISYQGRTVSIPVTGVVKDPPSETHLQFDLLLPFELAPSATKSWENQWPSAYLKLKKNVSTADFDAKISKVLKDHNPDWSSLLGLQPLRESHLNSIEGQKLSYTITIFTTLGLFILIMAGVNFINLTTARGTTRLKEIGVKKILGSSRRQLIGQILTESLCFSFAALAVAVFLARLLGPAAAALVGISIDMTLSWSVALMLAGVTLVTGLVSGLVPALIFSSFRLQDVLRGGFVSGNSSAGRLFKGLSPGLLMRRALAAFQLVLMISFMIAVFTIQRQMAFVMNKDLGLEKDHVITLGIPAEITFRYDAFKAELLKDARIMGVTGIGSPVVHRSNFQMTEWDGEQHPKVDCGLSWVDHDFAQTFGLEILEGRFFSKDLASDRSRAFVANEALIRAMGVEDPIGMQVRFNQTLGNIIGVVKDFHVESLHREIRPHMLILPSARYLRHLYVRIKPGEVPSALGFIKEKIDEFSPNYPFDYRFFSEEVRDFYRNERLTHGLIGVIMVIAILISSLGLFGLIAYAIERRTKEIGIRKVLGASSSRIFAMLTKEFLILVTAANILAWPVSYFILRRWLDGFAYRTDIGVSGFILAGLAALTVTLVTIAAQALKGAGTDPVDSLRYE